MRETLNNKTPVLILGGAENALSLLRSLSNEGIIVSVSADKECPAFYSRYCKNKYIVPKKVMPSKYWSDLLFKNKKESGSVILACSDYALEFIASNRIDLENTYIVEDHVKEVREALLNKLETLRLAKSAGVPAPDYWEIHDITDVHKIADELEYPVILKPLHSHLFQKHFGKKLFKIQTKKELNEKSKEVLNKNLKFMICELVPGPDSLLSSYYTYIDEYGNVLFEYTKRIIRRYPVNFGGGVYHESVWLPRTAELGLKFFKQVGLRGLGNIEFKQDPRDGKLKVIECNARFTAAQELLFRSDMDIAMLIYRKLTGGIIPKLAQNSKSLRLWYPVRDYRAYRVLRKEGKITLTAWLNSVLRKQIFPYFRPLDPLPSFMKLIFLIRHQFSR